MQGQWIRIHPRPKRYPAASTTDWASTVLYLDNDICVVNKPAGIPVQSHESNSAETVPRCLEQALGMKLWVSYSASLHEMLRHSSSTIALFWAHAGSCCMVTA